VHLVPCYLQPPWPRGHHSQTEDKQRYAAEPSAESVARGCTEAVPGAVKGPLGEVGKRDPAGMGFWMTLVLDRISLNLMPFLPLLPVHPDVLTMWAYSADTDREPAACRG